MQDELRCLEEQLEEVDQDNEDEDRLGSRKDDLIHAREVGEESPRERLIEAIRSRLVKYGS
jgi:hypothetical protein